MSCDTLVSFDVHPPERKQHEYGEALWKDPPKNSRAIPFNTLAGNLGVRFICCNPTLITLNPKFDHRCPERNALKARRDYIAERRPGAVIELHSSPASIRGKDYDSSLIIHPRPAPIVRKVAGYLASQGVPILETPGTFLPASVRQGMLLEMDERDPRFSYDALRGLIELITTDSLPDTPLPPLFKFQRDLFAAECQAVGIDTNSYLPPFSPIPPEQAVALNLHPDTRVTGVLPGLKYWAVAVTACSQAVSIPLASAAQGVGVGYHDHWCDTAPIQSPQLVAA